MKAWDALNMSALREAVNPDGVMLKWDGKDCGVIESSRPDGMTVQRGLEAMMRHDWEPVGKTLPLKTHRGPTREVKILEEGTNDRPDAT